MLRRRFLCQLAAGENDDDDVDMTSLLDGWGCSIEVDDDIVGVVFVSDEEEVISSNVLDDLSRVVMCLDLVNEQPVARILDGA